MALQPGATLGPYEILSLIGAGGMGEVYRARDPRLNREVAIKVLPADRVGDEGRRRRFVQEAHAASALNHPHIITIHEIEAADGDDFIVMEYVRGKSLDALIPRHGMRLGEVLRIAIPVADALAAAHARGIIHRDLKPANVMVGADGAVKVLDFGLAKLIGREDPEEAELTHTADVALSVPGTIAGTAAYMSPEQAAAGKVDARSDVFSFGAMLYEMVTGVRAFPGTSTADTLAAVLRAQPKAPTAIVPGVPRELEKVTLRCLRRDPDRRFQSMLDVKIELQEVKEESESGDAPVVLPRKRRRRLIAAMTVALMIAAGVMAWVLRPHREPPAPAPRLVPLTSLPGHERSPSFSPDGELVAFEWDGEKADNLDIYVKIIGSSELRRLTNDPAPDVSPVWSPDGKQIAFLRQRSEGTTIQIVSPLGGADRRLSGFRGANSFAWSPDSRWLVVGRAQPPHAPDAEAGGIFLLPVEGGEPRAIIRSRPGAFELFGFPAFSPDGRRLAYLSCPGCNVYAVDLNSDFAPAAPPRRLTRQDIVQGVGSVVWTRDGNSVVYDSGWGTLGLLWRVGVDGDSAPERIEVAGFGGDTPAIAHSKDRLAFTRISHDTDIYRFRAGHPAEPVAVSTFIDADPRLSADGHRLAFSSWRSGVRSEIYVAAADGVGTQQLTRGPGQKGSPTWSPDGQRVAFDSLGEDGKSHIWMIDADGGTPHRVTADAGDQNVPTWSQDGRWIYYSADGRDIARVPATGGPGQTIIRGVRGRFACESVDGRSLLYQQENADSPLLAVPLSGGPPRQLVACVKPTAFAARPEGIYYIACDPSSNPAIHVMDPDSGEDRLLGRVEQLEQHSGLLSFGLAVLPDAKSVLYLRHLSDGSDLMLIENFR